MSSVSGLILLNHFQAYTEHEHHTEDLKGGHGLLVVV